MILVLCDNIGTSLLKVDLGSNPFRPFGTEGELRNAADIQIRISEPMAVTKFYIMNDEGKVLWYGPFSRDMSVSKGDCIAIKQGELRLGLLTSQE